MSPFANAEAPSAPLGTKGAAQPNVDALQLSPSFWFAVVLTGAGAGLAGGLLMRLLSTIQHLSFGYDEGDFLRGVTAASGGRRALILALAGLIAGLVLLATRHLWTEPVTDLNEAMRSHGGRMSAGATLVKALLSILTVGMGSALGREGALKDAGGVWANQLCDWCNLGSAERRLLVACGAASGMAAAYNVPLGGALFAAEVLLGSLTLRTILPVFTASFAGVFVSWLMLPDLPAYTFPELSATRALVLWSVPAGPVLGLAAKGWVHCLAWAKSHKTSGWRVVLLPIAALTILGVGSIWFPALLGNGKNVVQLTFLNGFAPGLLLWLAVLRPVASLLCLRSGTPGGLFTPTMTFGALLGEGGGRLWQLLHAGQEPTAAYALVGSAALLSAATLAPLSSVVFLLELTRRADSLMVPLLIAVTGATLTARQFNSRSIYSSHG